jgi:hypothetical protein
VQEVAGRLNSGGGAAVDSVSCASAGNCSAGGTYLDRSKHYQAFVVNEKTGAWGKAQEVAGALNAGGIAGVDSVSCASVGNCSAGGFYVDGSDNQQAFAVDEKNGTWGTAEEVPGTAALNTGGNAEVDSVSCASAGNCGAGGDYTQKSSGEFGNPQAFVVNKS